MITETKAYVYFLENEVFPGLMKVGFTDRTPEKRAAELYTSGLPAPYTVNAYIECKNSGHARKLERLIHEELSHLRFNSDREFFIFNSDQFHDLFQHYPICELTDCFVSSEHGISCSDFPEFGSSYQPRKYTHSDKVDDVTMLNQHIFKLETENQKLKKENLKYLTANRRLVALRTNESPSEIEALRSLNARLEQDNDYIRTEYVMRLEKQFNNKVEDMRKEYQVKFDTLYGEKERLRVIKEVKLSLWTVLRYFFTGKQPYQV